MEFLEKHPELKLHIATIRGTYSTCDKVENPGTDLEEAWKHISQCKRCSKYFSLKRERRDRFANMPWNPPG